MTEKKDAVSAVLSDKLHDALLGDDWFKGLLRHVQRVSAERASRVIPGGDCSAAGQVGHALYWLQIGRSWLAGEDVEGDQDVSFRYMTVNTEEWKALRAQFENELTLFQQDIARVEDWDAKKLGIVLNQLSHIAYHAGSVAQILKATK